MSTKPTRRKKKKEIFKEVLTHSHPQQPPSAALLSSHYQQIFSAASLSSHFRRPFSAATLSSHSQQLFSAALLGSHYQQIFSASSLSSHFQQPLSAAIPSYHLAVVRGWWSAIISSCCCGRGLVVGHWIIILLWSVVGGQLRARSLEGPFRGAFGKRHQSCPVSKE